MANDDGALAVREQENPIAKREPIAISEQNWLQIRSIAEAKEVSEIILKSGLAPKGYDSVPAIMTAIMFGAELGLGALASLQSIANINGRPCVYGDVLLAICQADRAYVAHDEGWEGEPNTDAFRAWCEITVRTHGGGAKSVRREFAIGNAKRAGLWGKQGPWTNYPERMLQMRARAFALRDALPGACKGMPTREEVIDLAESQYSVITAPQAPPASEPKALDVEKPSPTEPVHREKPARAKPEREPLSLEDESRAADFRDWLRDRWKSLSKDQQNQVARAAGGDIAAASLEQLEAAVAKCEEILGA